MMWAASIWLVAILAMASSVAPGSRGLRAAGESAEEGEIRAVLDAQAAAWNGGDIDSFMLGYRKSDETLFVGARGVTRGWQAVLERYRRDYPDTKAMGHLSFTNLEIHVQCADAAFVIGEYQLEREKSWPAGLFTLNFRKFAEGWRIVADHTTAFAAPAATAGKSN
jgi:ketosteroid isomerase-like protein